MKLSETVLSRGKKNINSLKYCFIIAMFEFYLRFKIYIIHFYSAIGGKIPGV